MARRRPADSTSDRELLARFVSAREDSAFAALVQRHGASVLGVCKRVLGNEHDAEDVFQATFLTLARKAAVVPWQESIKPWLHAVAQRLAVRARCTAQRRRGRYVPLAGTVLAETTDGHDDPLAEVARRELRLVLAEELRQLPEKYRAPAVLCYLEGKTNEQAAGELGWPAGSMSRRLARARALLHDRLSRRGLALAVGLCVLGLLSLIVVPAGPPSRPSLRAEMAAFRPGGEHEEGFDVILRGLADGGPERSEAQRRRLVRTAYRTAQVAETIQGHDPGRRRQHWRHLAVEMRLSALDLAEALAHHDEPTTRTAAWRLTATCQACHATFRD
jgi:RNA polymerase sigma-70 factor (ECF subfamily)